MCIHHPSLLGVFKRRKWSWSKDLTIIVNVQESLRQSWLKLCLARFFYQFHKMLGEWSKFQVQVFCLLDWKERSSMANCCEQLSSRHKKVLQETQDTIFKAPHSDFLRIVMKEAAHSFVVTPVLRWISHTSIMSNNTFHEYQESNTRIGSSKRFLMILELFKCKELTEIQTHCSLSHPLYCYSTIQMERQCFLGRLLCHCIM